MDGRGWRSDDGDYKYPSFKKRARNEYGICLKRQGRKSKEKSSNPQLESDQSIIPETIITLYNSGGVSHDFSEIALQPLIITTTHHAQNDSLELDSPLANNYISLIPPSSPAQARRQPKLCPLNRINFSSTFTTLIKYNRPNSKPSKRRMKIVSKQYSVTIDSFQGTLFEELRSYISACSIDQYNDYLECERSNCGQMILLITGFNLVNDSQEKIEHSSLALSLSNLSIEPLWKSSSLSLNNLNLSGNFEQDLSQHLSTSGYVPFTSNESNDNDQLFSINEESSGNQYDIFTIQHIVKEYTNGIHQCFDLYPSFSRFLEDHPNSKKELFKNRYTTLCLWENVTTEIESSLQSVHQSCCDTHPSKLYLASSLREIPKFIGVSTYETFLNEHIKRQDISIPFVKTMNCLENSLSKLVKLYTNIIHPRITFDWMVELESMGLPSFTPMVIQLMITPLEIMTGSMEYLLKLCFEPPAPSLPTVCQLLTQQKQCIKKYVVLKDKLQEMFTLISYEENDCPPFDDLVSMCDSQFNELILRHLVYCRRLAPDYLKNNNISQMIADEWRFLRSISYIQCPIYTFKTFNDGFCVILDIINVKLKDIIENHLPNTLHWESHREIRDQCVNIQNKMQKLFTNVGQVIMRDVINYSEYTFINSFKKEAFLKQMKKEEYSLVVLESFADEGVFIFYPRVKKNRGTSISTDMSKVVFDLWNKFTGTLHVSCKNHILVLKSNMKKIPWDGSTIDLLPEHTMLLNKDNRLSLLDEHLYLICSDYQMLQRHKKPFGTKFELYIQRDNNTVHLLHDLTMIFGKIEMITNTITEFIVTLESTFLQQLEQCITFTDVYCALLKTIYGLAFETVTDMVHMIGRNLGFKLYHSQIIHICTNWMNHVTKSCPQGTGKIPSWAVQGLQFIAFCSDIKSLERMDEEQFETWKRNVDECYCYIIGDNSRSKKGSILSPTFSRRRPSIDNSDTSICSSTPSPVLMRNPEAFSDRLSSKTEEVDLLRDSLLQDMGMIGMPANVPPNYVTQNPLKLNQSVGFRWIKGNVIGQGTFGVVYSCTNVENDTVIALKQIPVTNIDQGDLLKLVDEIKVNACIRHENIISYYGYEFHQHALLIFMELCDSGSLYELSQCGLQEVQARDYTRQLLKAVRELHKWGIIHRDIKGGNIFICGNTLKLGDFGAAVRLSTVRGTRDGEFRDLHGTVAYMAPEIIRKPDQGHGRAVDLWSVGCVVLEMLSGKRPWPEYHEDIPIIFRLGKGCAPSIPDHCSSESIDFMNKCFKINPAERWTADKLLGHSFVLI